MYLYNGSERANWRIICIDLDRHSNKHPYLTKLCYSHLDSKLMNMPQIPKVEHAHRMPHQVTTDKRWNFLCISTACSVLVPRQRQ